MSVMPPFSMCSSSDCCCFLLKYWISSRYSRMPSGAIIVPSWATTSRMSWAEAVVALRRQSFRRVRRAIRLATVVLPTPEGP